MRFPFKLIHGFEDCTRNFEEIETRFGVPVFAAAPPNPHQGQMYLDSTRALVPSASLGYYTGSVWTYL